MLLLTYGQPKSASTFLWQIAKRACDLKMGGLGPVRARFFGPGYDGNWNFWSGSLGPLKDMVKRLNDDDYLTLKTHSGLHAEIEPEIRQGRIVPFISYRNLGDSALSVYEAGEKARQEENYNEGFYKIETHREAIDYIGTHVTGVTMPWIKSGFGYNYSYETLTETPEVFVADLARTLQMPAERLTSDEEIAGFLAGKRRVYNFNKGVSGRYASVFSQADIDYMNETYATFVRFCDGEIGAEDL